MKTNRFRIATILGFIGLATFSIAVYLTASRIAYRLGFPLDDAWIHQTYARNLGIQGDWAYLPGQPSAGSTSPLWSGLLSIGYFLGSGPYIWTYLLGLVLLIVIAIFGIHVITQLNPGDEKLAVIAGLVMIFEWHLVWAAVSGMETILFACFVLYIFTLLLARKKRWFLIGVLAGLSTFARPDGLTSLGPIIFVLITEKITKWTKISSGIALITGFVLMFGLYLIMNSALADSFWPNTFYAKQAEYASELLDPLWLRLLEQFKLPLVGVGAILLPGFIYFIYNSYQNRAWNKLSLALWATGFLVVYAVRLPVTYQHGRYAIPMMPVYLLCALSGTMLWVNIYSPSLMRRVISKSLIISGAVLLFLFWLLGARAYSRDVAIIESEMVNTAEWIAANTDTDVIIAAHDIGALGYFSQRKLIDLAGLVSPDVIPFIRDEVRIADYLDKQQVTYLVTFPGWYPLLLEDRLPVYQTNAQFSPQQGGENMRVYLWEHKTNP